MTRPLVHLRAFSSRGHCLSACDHDPRATTSPSWGKVTCPACLAMRRPTQPEG